MQRGCSPTPHRAPSNLQGQAATSLPGPCQRCLNLHTTNSRRNLPLNSEKQGLTNLMQNVMSRPGWLLLVTPIFFYLSEFPLRAVGFCQACCSASITEVTAAKKKFSLLPTLAFHFLPWSTPCSKLAFVLERQLHENNKPTAGLRNNPTKRKKLFFSLGQVAESPCSDKNAGANLEKGQESRDRRVGTHCRLRDRDESFHTKVSMYVCDSMSVHILVFPSGKGIRKLTRDWQYHTETLWGFSRLFLQDRDPSVTVSHVISTTCRLGQAFLREKCCHLKHGAVVSK